MDPTGKTSRSTTRITLNALEGKDISAQEGWKFVVGDSLQGVDLGLTAFIGIGVADIAVKTADKILPKTVTKSISEGVKTIVSAPARIIQNALEQRAIKSTTRQLVDAAILTLEKEGKNITKEAIQENLEKAGVKSLSELPIESVIDDALKASQKTATKVVVKTSRETAEKASLKAQETIQRVTARLNSQVDNLAQRISQNESTDKIKKDIITQVKKDFPDLSPENADNLVNKALQQANTKAAAIRKAAEKEAREQAAREAQEKASREAAEKAQAPQFPRIPSPKPPQPNPLQQFSQWIRNQQQKTTIQKEASQLANQTIPDLITNKKTQTELNKQIATYLSQKLPQLSGREIDDLTAKITAQTLKTAQEYSLTARKKALQLAANLDKTIEKSIQNATSLDPELISQYTYKQITETLRNNKLLLSDKEIEAIAKNSAAKAKSAAQKALKEAQQKAQRTAVQVPKVPLKIITSSPKVSKGALRITGAGTHGQDAVGRAVNGFGASVSDGVSLGRSGPIAESLRRKGLAPNAPPQELANGAAEFMGKASQMTDPSSAIRYIKEQYLSLNRQLVTKYGDDVASANIAAGFNPDTKTLFVAKVGDCKAYQLTQGALKEIGPPDQSIGNTLLNYIGSNFEGVEVTVHQNIPAKSQILLMSDGIEKFFTTDPSIKSSLAQIISSASDPDHAEIKIMEYLVQKAQTLFNGKLPDDLSISIIQLP